MSQVVGNGLSFSGEAVLRRPRPIHQVSDIQRPRKPAQSTEVICQRERREKTDFSYSDHEMQMLTVGPLGPRLLLLLAFSLLSPPSVHLHRPRPPPPFRRWLYPYIYIAHNSRLIFLLLLFPSFLRVFLYLSVLQENAKDGITTHTYTHISQVSQKANVYTIWDPPSMQVEKERCSSTWKFE